MSKRNNRIIIDDDKISITDGVSFAKSFIGSKEPYVIHQQVSGVIVAFSDHFIEMLSLALSENCMASMTRKEKKLYTGYIQWVVHREQIDISVKDESELVYHAIDKWLEDELRGNEHPVPNVCSR